jgi:hypothetical protein
MACSRWFIASLADVSLLDSLYQRQRSKTDLADIVEGGDVTAGLDEEVGMVLGKNPGERRMSLTRSDVLQLVYPDRHREEGGCDVADGQVMELPDEVLQSVREELGSELVLRAHVLD